MATSNGAPSGGLLRLPPEAELGVPEAHGAGEARGPRAAGPSGARMARL